MSRYFRDDYSVITNNNQYYLLNLNYRTVEQISDLEYQLLHRIVMNRQTVSYEGLVTLARENDAFQYLCQKWSFLFQESETSSCAENLNQPEELDWVTPQLKSLFIYLTNECHCKCVYCYALKDRGSLYLPSSIAEKIIHSAYKMGVRNIQLTGGEPLLHPDIFKIVELILRHRINLTLLTKEALDDKTVRLFSKYQFAPTLSIDSLEPSVVNVIQRRNEAHKIALSNLASLRQYNCDFNISTVITPENMSYLTSDLEQFMIFEPKRVFFNFEERSVGNERRILSSLERRNVLLHLKSYVSQNTDLTDIVVLPREEEGEVECSYGFDRIGVDVKGNIIPCERMIGVYNLGSVVKTDLFELWKWNSKEREFLVKHLAIPDYTFWHPEKSKCCYRDLFSRL